MLLGERNFDFIRMRRRGKVVIGHRASYKRDKDNLCQEQAQRAKLYHISRIPASCHAGSILNPFWEQKCVI
jgi:hypothetical protein